MNQLGVTESMRALYGLVFAGVASCTTTAPLELLPSTIPVDPSTATGAEVVEGRACAPDVRGIVESGERTST